MTTVSVTKIVISGATGRMGKAITRAAAELPDDIKIVGGLVSEKSCSLGKDIGLESGVSKLDVPACTDVSGLQFNVLIDFSTPQALKQNLAVCVQQSTGILVGTTGLTEEQNTYLTAAAESIPVLFAANTSVGVNLCAALVETAARVIGDVTDVEIIEAHHKYKVDAPSGTALLLGEAAAAGMGSEFPDCGVFSREGITGERPAGSIGFSAIRGGNIAGEHTVMFIGENERLEITYRVSDRAIFAKGALKAAIWLGKQKKGLYCMQDMLDLR